MKELLGIALVALVLAAAGLSAPEKATAGPGGPGPKTFASYGELKTFLKEKQGGYEYQRTFSSRGLLNFNTAMAAPPMAMSTPAAAAPAPAARTESRVADFSGTNIQVAGVDEADIVKTDGKYLYVLSRGRILVLSAVPAESARVLSRIEPGGQVQEMFVHGDRLVVLGQEYEQAEPVVAYGFPRAGMHSFSPPFYGTSRTSVKVYDIARRETPRPVQNLSADGTYFDARLIGNHVYVVVNNPVRWFAGEVLLPRVTVNGAMATVAAPEIDYFNTTESSYQFTTFLSVDLAGRGEPKREVYLIGQAQTLYVSSDHIYVTHIQQEELLPRYDQWGIQWEPSASSMEKTVIHKISIRDGEVRYVTSGSVPGRLLNQFSLDQHNGFLRVATTTGEVWSGNSANHVFVLDGELSLIGRLENLARGERIYSARFLGDRLYMVTFKKVDPLFVIDLKDARSPKVLGELKIPGYSDYLHPYDENRIIGVGKDTIESGSGNFAWYQGLKLALFDVSNVSSPKEVAKAVVGDRGTDSEVLRDHKALLFSKAKNLLVLPVDLALISGPELAQDRLARGRSSPAYGQPVFQGAYVWSLTPEKGFEFRGRITHHDGGDAYGFGDGSDLDIRRSLYIGETLYTVSEGMVRMNRLDTLREIGQIRLE